MNYSIINDFFNEIGNDKIALDDNRILQIKALIWKSPSGLASDSRIIRKISRIRGLDTYSASQLIDLVKRYYAFAGACSELCQRGVAVYYINRVEKKDGFDYSSDAFQRMEEHKNFPSMYEDIDGNHRDLSRLFDSKYSKEYIEEIGKIPQVIQIGEYYCHKDYKSRYINVINGMRVTSYQPCKFDASIHMYGRCGCFGYAVEDSDTMPSYLQKLINDSNCGNFRVVNHGLWGGEDYMIDENFLRDSDDFKKGDIVVFYKLHLDYKIMKWLEQFGVIYEDITDEWHAFDESKWCFYDDPGHMNGLGYKNVAHIIFEKLRMHNFANVARARMIENVHADYYKEFTLGTKKDELFKQVSNYLNQVIPIGDRHSDGVNGAIVMNCNPFTYGHKYLIEYAANQVDYLYIFVVEEDKSFFSFADRFRMVVDGTAKLPNVYVIPSGKFIISSYTFPEYFMKDYVKEKSVEPTEDVRIFCRYIAPQLSIRKRFVGEEPFDVVTRNYNETMKKIFPEYSMELIEIPRKKMEDDRIICATDVRKYINESEYEEISKYVPDTTYEILKEKYFKCR